MIKENIIQAKTFDFSIKIISLYKNLIDKNEFVLSKQLLKSATSIGANVEEALAGQTKKDFIAKMSLASKEARETRYWLKLLNKSQIVTNECSAHLKEVEEIVSILTAIVKTSQKSLE